MFGPFKLRKPLGRSYNVDLGDVRQTKQALNGLGFYRMPSFGLTDYPDEALFDGIERFQRSNGLTADGVMKPDGITAETLGGVLARRRGSPAPQGIVAGEWDWQRDRTRSEPHRRPPFSTVAWPGRRTAGTFGILGPVGHRQRNDPRDVIAAKRGLAWAGHYPWDKARDPDGRVDDDLISGIGAIQRAKGLKTDHWMGPGGETERTADRTISPMIRTASAEKTPSPKPSGGTAPAPKPKFEPPPRKPIPTGTDTPDGQYTSPIDKEFRDELSRRESARDGYRAVNPDNGGIGALGRYQMRKGALQEAGLLDAQGNWTGKHGIKSTKDFLGSPDAQERAFADFMQTKHARLQRNGAFKEVGRSYQGKRDRITVTESGLLAAAHRAGATKVKGYLDHLRSRGWKSDFSGLTEMTASRYKAIETRLREFQDTPIRRRQATRVR